MRYIVWWKSTPAARRRFMRKYGADPNELKRGSVVKALGPKDAEKKWRAEMKEYGWRNRVFVSVTEDQNYKPIQKRELKLLHRHMRRLKKTGTNAA